MALSVNNFVLFIGYITNKVDSKKVWGPFVAPDQSLKLLDDAGVFSDLRVECKSRDRFVAIIYIDVTGSNLVLVLQRIIQVMEMMLLGLVVQLIMRQEDMTGAGHMNLME